MSLSQTPRPSREGSLEEAANLVSHQDLAAGRQSPRWGSHKGLPGLLRQAPERPGQGAGALVGAPPHLPRTPLVAITDIKVTQLEHSYSVGQVQAKASADKEISGVRCGYWCGPYHPETGDGEGLTHVLSSQVSPQPTVKPRQPEG